MESSRRVGAAFGTAALLGTLVAGCGADDSSGAAPPTAPHPPSISLVTEPARSAIGSVRAWIAARNDALRNGRTGAAVALAGSCDTCGDVVERIERVHAAGGSFHGGRWQVDRAVVTEQSGARVTVAADITVAPGMTRASDESEPEVHSRNEISLRFVVDPSERSPVLQLVFLSPRADGVAGAVGSMIGGG